MKNYILVFSALALSACFGGGGNNAMVPPVMDVRTSNLVISSNIDNETRRIAHVTEALGAEYYSETSGGLVSNPGMRGASTRGGGNENNICKSARDCNDVAFNNMKAWLIDNIDSFDEWDDNQKLRQALKMAGFGSVLAGNWDDIKDWAQTHKAEIQAKAQEIYDELGTHQNFDITQSDFTVLDNSGSATTKLKFLVNDDSRITEIVVEEEKGTPYQNNIHGVRNQDTSHFHVGGRVYEYKLSNIAPQYDPDAGDSRYISFSSPTELTLDQIKAKLIAIADYEISLGEGGEDGFFGTYHNNCTPQDVYAALILQINNLDSDWENLSVTPEDQDYVFNVDSYGKQVGLAYSDFGMLRVLETSDDIDPDQTYHGGYTANIVSNAHITELAQNANTAMTFNGRATGRVLNARAENHDEDDTTTYNFMYIDGDASLTFNGGEHGVETLSMEFPDWYDVTVVRTDGDTENATITFNNYTNQSDDADLYMFRTPGEVAGHTSYTPDTFVGQSNIDTNDDGMSGRQEGALAINYYAATPTSNPSEVSGYAAYSESEPGFEAEGYDDMINRLEFQAAFGAIRQY